MSNMSQSQEHEISLSVQGPKRKHEFSATNLSLGPPSYHVRHARKWHASIAEFCKADKAKRSWQTSEAQTRTMRHAPRAAAKTRLSLLESPAVQPPGIHLYNLQAHQQMEGDSYTLAFHSLPLTSGARGKRFGPKHQSLWMKTAILLDLMMARLLSLWLYASQASSFLPSMLNLPPLYSACYALNSPTRQVFILFLCTYFTWSATLSPADEHCLGKSPQQLCCQLS